MAMILNNLGFVYYLTGDSQTGLTLSQQALEIAESVGMERQIAANHSTLGEIYVAFDQYQEALAHCEEALAFFEREADEEWMAVVYHELARAKYHQAFDTLETPIERRKERLEEALRYAERGLQLCEDHGLLKEAPVIQYRIGSIKLDLGEVEEAEKHLRKSLELSKGREERFHSMVALAALSELAYLKSDKTTVKEIASEARELMGIPARGEYPLFFGRTLRTLAEVYLDEEKYDQALETYVEALTHIGRHGGYGKYRFDREVRRLRERIARLPEAVRAGWSDCFIERWEADGERAAEHPEVVIACLLAKVGP
jgi:tetratricopeptide (TPR) repeat protein